jgi:hypothetical protein
MGRRMLPASEVRLGTEPSTQNVRREVSVRWQTGPRDDFVGGPGLTQLGRGRDLARLTLVTAKPNIHVPSQATRAQDTRTSLAIGARKAEA